MSETLVVYMVFVAPWLLVGWLRIPRYVAYFQRADYSINGYTSLLENGKTENRYMLICLGLTAVLFLVLGCALTSLGTMLVKQPLAMVLIYLGLLAAAITFLPRKLTFDQPNKREPRAIRLLVASFGVELLPIIVVFVPIWSLLAAIFDPNNSPESMILAFGLIFVVLALGICAGPLTFALTPYSVVGGYLLNRLVERIFRLRMT